MICFVEINHNLLVSKKEEKKPQSLKVLVFTDLDILYDIYKHEHINDVFILLWHCFGCKLHAQIADRSVITVARQHHTRSHACSFALSVVANVFAFLLALMETSKTALVTTIGRPKKAVQNVLNFLFISK